ncbi:hypothetical protein Clacol_009087 [Clathrus columnatus]|uniref:AMP-dependent synthetase/ligase domain-containing protein n=1 Tax=Clathrus columnatus TaxID=1419009 RepID=A0AAV5AJK6_9AGAM|nr:hypothetical protein Clacol_009087 [Clathrus columnatus]
MYTLSPGLVILVAHSMGGLLAADAAYAAASAERSQTRILGILACDVPYLGMHPHVVLSGIASLLPKRKKKEDESIARRSEDNTPRTSLPTGDSRFYLAYNEKEMNDERVVDCIPEPPDLTNENQTGKPNPNSPIEKRQQPGLLVPPPLPPRPLSCPSNPHNIASSSFTSPKELYPPPPAHPYVHQRTKSQPNVSLSVGEPTTLLPHVLHFLHLNGLVSELGDTPTKSLSKLSDRTKQQAISYYHSIVETMEFGITMFDPKGLLRRYKALTEWKGRWFVFWSVAIRHENPKKKPETNPIDKAPDSHPDKSSDGVKSFHHFVVTPREKSNWERIVIHGAKDEVQAHIGLFRRDLNWEYDAFVKRAAYVLSRWIAEFDLQLKIEMATFDRIRENHVPAGFSQHRQSLEVSGSRVPGYSGDYRNAGFAPITYTSPLARKNLLEVFQSGLNVSPNGKCLGHRPIISVTPQVTYAPYFIWQTYREVDTRRRNVGSAFHFLRTHGRVGGGQLSTVGIWSYNRPEWQLIDLAIQAYAGVSVSLYNSFGPDAIEYICNHAEISIVFLLLSHLPAFLSIGSKLTFLRAVVCIEDLLINSPRPNPDPIEFSRKWASQLGLEFFTFSEFEALGAEHLIAPMSADPEQIYSICYTSASFEPPGTTGNPKGVILRHGQCAMTTAAVAHCRPFQSRYLTGGDPTRLAEDMKILQPTELIVVPRILNRFYQLLKNGMGIDKSELKAKILKRAINDKLAILRKSGQLTHPVWDRLIFNKIKTVFGGKIRMISTGSAPVAPEILDFFRATLGSYICEATYPTNFDRVGFIVLLGVYGLTETFAVTVRTLFNDIDSSGTVGPPQVSTEVKLKDVPSMGYTSLDKPNPRGEILCRGINVITRDKGYYKDPELTAVAVDEEGWFHTGDVGEIDSYGRFRIIDRVKNLLKLSQGAYVGLEKVESAYSSCPAISQIYIHGDSLQDYLVAVIVPEVSFLSRVGITQKPNQKDDDINDTRVINLLLSELTEHAEKMGLRGFERVRQVYLTFESFSMENGLLTPTLKLRRRTSNFTTPSPLHLNGPIAELSDTPTKSLSKLSDRTKQQAISYYHSIVETMEFGITMFDPKGLLRRYKALTEWKSRWFVFWSVAIRHENPKKPETNPIDKAPDSHPNESSDGVKSFHRYIVTPREKSNWERIVIHGAKDEVQAHIGLFKRDLNWEYDAFVERAAYVLSRWIAEL